MSKEKIDYKKINEYLNDYCSTLDNSYFLNNLEILYTLTYDLYRKLKNSIIADGEKTESIRTPKKHLTLLESLDLVSKYLDERLPMYKEKYNKDFASGIINIVGSVDQYTEDKKNRAGIDEKGNHDINIVLDYNATDPNTIIHEFLHDVNCNEEISITRQYITEAISIYFELDINKFMLEEGISQQDIASLLLYRLNDCYHVCEESLNFFPFLYYFYNLGPVNENSYQDLVNLDISPRPASKESYNHSLSSFQKYIEKNEYYNPLSKFGYIIGSVIAFYGIEQGEEFHQKMIELNSIANTKDIEQVLKHLDINIYKKTCVERMNSCLDKGIDAIELAVNERSIKQKN